MVDPSYADDLARAVAAGLTITPEYLQRHSKAYGSPATCTLTSAADATVNAALANTNFGTSTSLSVSPNTLATQRAFVRFDLTGCSPAIPADAIVQSATLQLTVASAVLQLAQ